MATSLAQDKFKKVKRSRFEIGIAAKKKKKTNFSLLSLLLCQASKVSSAHKKKRKKKLSIFFCALCDNFISFHFKRETESFFFGVAVSV